MPYSVCKDRGSYRILHESWANNKRTMRHVRKSEYQRLGIQPGASWNEIKEVLKHLNANERVRKDEDRRNRLEVRRIDENKAECAFLPPHLVKQFEKNVVKAKMLRESHWEEAKRVIRAVMLEPKDWSFSGQHFYNYLIGKKFSPDYSGRIIKMLNEWGAFYCWQMGCFWKPIPHVPQGRFANRLREAYEKRTSGGRASARLSFVALANQRRKLTEAEYAWLFISIAFGLRPEEINRSLNDPDKWAYRDSHLYVYQYKLERIEPNSKRRWKRIEIVLEEQKQALELIKKGVFKAPTRKKMKSLFGPKVTYYAGRKEFCPYLLKLGFDPYKISKWLGHRDLTTMRRHYDDPEEDYLVG